MQGTTQDSARQSDRFTWDDYVSLPDDDRRELIDGRLEEGEVPTKVHAFVVVMLSHLLMTWALPRKAGFVLSSGYRVRISPRRGVTPDLHFYRSRTFESLPMQGLDDGHPDLVVEVISPGSVGRDRIVKSEYYASIGTPEYWLVDPEARTFERFLLENGRYLPAERFLSVGRFEPDTFPGLVIDIASLWMPPTSDAT